MLKKTLILPILRHNYLFLYIQVSQDSNLPILVEKVNQIITVFPY